MAEYACLPAGNQYFWTHVAYNVPPTLVVRASRAYPSFSFLLQSDRLRNERMDGPQDGGGTGPAGRNLKKSFDQKTLAGIVKTASDKSVGGGVNEGPRQVPSSRYKPTWTIGGAFNLREKVMLSSVAS